MGRYFHEQNYAFGLPLDNSPSLECPETPLSEPCESMNENDTAHANENDNIISEHFVEPPTHEIMLESETVNGVQQIENNVIPLLNMHSEPNLVNKGKTQNKTHVSLCDDELMLCKEIANMVENCFVDASIFEITDESVETMDAQSVVEPCRVSKPKVVEEVEEVLPTGEHTWFKLEFAEIVPHVQELQHLFLENICSVPYWRKKSANEKGFFWYRDGYSES